jgi:peptide/nickel transport system permease protein
MNSPATSAPKESLHDWLMSERPQSRRQASLGRAYGAWRTFARNRLAMLGLAIVLALVLIAIFADQLAPYSPYIGDLRTTRLLPPSGAHWFGTDDQGRDILSRFTWWRWWPCWQPRSDWSSARWPDMPAAGSMRR